VSADNKADYQNIGAFFLGKAYLLEDKNLIFNAGLRYDEFDLSLDNWSRSNTTGALDSAQMYGKFDKKYDKILPSVGLAYNPVDFLKLRANYAQAFKVPTPRELAGGFRMMNYFQGNTNLEPQESNTWEIGFDYDRNFLGVSGTYFQTDYKNYIYAPSMAEMGATGGQIRQYINLPDVTISGLEFKLDYQLGRAVGWGADVTPYINWTRLLKYELTSDMPGIRYSGTPSAGQTRPVGALIFQKGDKLANVAQDSLGFGVELDYEPFSLTVNIDGTYFGARDIGTFNRHDEQLRQGGATVWDLSLVKTLYAFDDANSLKVKVAANNFFDKSYDASVVSGGAALGVSELMPGSSYYVGMIYEFK
jgi:vitamin B12 transporter